MTVHNSYKKLWGYVEVCVGVYPRDEKALKGLDGDYAVIAGKDYGRGKLSPDELIRILDNRDKITYKGLSLERIAIQPCELDDGTIIADEMEVWLHFQAEEKLA